MTKASPIYGPDPFLDDNGVLRVGGRLRKSSLNWNLMHPILLPQRDMTLNKIRSNAFWIINGNVAVVRGGGGQIYKCVTCRKLRGKLGEQKMTDLPEEISSDASPFTYVGMASWSIHIEVVNSMDRLLYHVFEKVYWTPWKCENDEV